MDGMRGFEMWFGKVVERVPKGERARSRRARMADSLMVGNLKDASGERTCSG